MTYIWPLKKKKKKSVFVHHSIPPAHGILRILHVQPALLKQLEKPPVYLRKSIP